MKAQLLFSTLTIFLAQTFLLHAQPWDAMLTLTDGDTARAQITAITAQERNDEGNLVKDGQITFKLPNQNAKSLPFRLFEDVEFLTLPDPFVEAEQHVQDNNLILARPAYETVLRLFNGLPSDIIGITYTRLADIYITQEKYEEAEEFLQQYANTYADADTDLDQVKLGEAQIAVAKKNYDEALELLQPLTDIAKNHESVSEREANYFARVFFSLAQAQEELGNLSQALENYLKVVTVYFHDTAMAQAADEKAQELRATNPQITVP